LKFFFFHGVQATKEAFESARALTKKLQSKEAALVGAQVNFPLDVVDVLSDKRVV